MSASTLLRRLPVAGLTLLTLVAAGACGDSPTSDDDLDIVGLVIVNSGFDLVTITGLDVEGAVFVEQGGQTDPLEFLFVDQRGNRFTPRDADLWLRVTVVSSPFVEWVPDTPGGFTGVFRGMSPGTTTVRFELMRGGVGSATSQVEFGTPAAPFVVS